MQLNDIYYIRQSTCWGGHAESQLICDIEDAFSKNSDTIVKLFTPPSYNKDSIYMCGLEVFGTYDMCDIYNNKGNNKYNCVGKLQEFREKHQPNGQEGQKSISKAIMDKLKRRFKGEEENAFVVIYHAQQPYNNVDTYYIYNSNDEILYPVSYQYNNGFCIYSHHSEKFNDACSLSQREDMQIKPKHLYGYIHCLANKKIPYDEKSSSLFINEKD